MGAYQQFLLDNDSVEITANAGEVTARFRGKKIYEGKYVTGDMEDKMAETLRGYKTLVTHILAMAEKVAVEPSSLLGLKPRNLSLEEILAQPDLTKTKEPSDETSDN